MGRRRFALEQNVCLLQNRSTALIYCQTKSEHYAKLLRN
jgi:hypothetical protein